MSAEQPQWSESQARASALTRELADGQLSRAIKLLRVFPADGRPISGTEASRLTGLSKTTTHRTLSSLEVYEMVRRLDSGWTLSWGLLDLAVGAQSGQSLGLVPIARPWMTEGYAHARGNAVHLLVRDGRQLVIAEKIGGRGANELPTRVGMKVPIETTAAGMAIGRRRIAGAAATSDSPRIWIQAVYRRDEGIPGVACAAAPIYSGRLVVGAVSVSGASDDLDGPTASKVACWIAKRVSRDATQAHSVPR